MKYISNDCKWKNDNFVLGCTNVRLNDGTTCHMKENGEELYSERYEMVYNFNETKTAVANTRKYAFHIGMDGKPLYTRRFTNVSEFNENGVAKANVNGYDFLIGLDGENIK